MIIDIVPRPLLFSLLSVILLLRPSITSVTKMTPHRVDTRSIYKKNLMFKVHLLRSDRVYPVIQSRLSVQISPHGSFTVRGLSELICQKVGGKKNSSVGHQSTWGYTPHSTWKKKKVTGLENNKILSVFGSDSGKLQTDAVVCFLLMALQSRMYDVYYVYNFRCGKYIL